MADIFINGKNLGSSPVTNIEDEFFRTGDGEIIGGVHKISINGSIVGLDGTAVMSELKSLRELGKTALCVPIITDLYRGRAKIENVTIPQGPDPSWINQGEFSIELTAQMDKIPNNRFGFIASDNVREFSQSESLSLGDDHHGYLVIKRGGAKLSKTFVKFSTKMSIRCDSFCGGTDQSVKLLQDRLHVIPNHPALVGYGAPVVGNAIPIDIPKRDWIVYPQSRSLDISSQGTVSFSADAILVDPLWSMAIAFVEYSAAINTTYSPDPQYSVILSGNIQGLSKVDWTDLITLTDTCGGSDKLTNALDVFNKAGKWLFDFELVDVGSNILLNALKLVKQNNCPVTSSASQASCASTTPTSEEISTLIKAASSSVTTNRTSGSVDFSLSWEPDPTGGGASCAGADGASEDFGLTITPEVKQYAIHTIPRYGTIIQDLICLKNEKLSFTASRKGSAGQGLGLCDPVTLPGCEPVGSNFDKFIKDYMLTTKKTYLLLSHSKNFTNESSSEQKEFIELCPQFAETAIIP